jgi:putative ABC transport system permease protein
MSGRYIGNLVQDIRFALRTVLLRNRVVTVVSVVTLALGIGASTAVFSVIDAVLLKPLPYPEPHRLFRLYQTFDRAGNDLGVVTGPGFVDYRDRVKSFDSLACLFTYEEVGFDLTGGERPERVVAMRISSGFFKTIGQEPALGREFTREEEQAGVNLTVVSHGLWQRHLGGNQESLGESLVLDGEPFTVVGVMPVGFHDIVGGDVDLWTVQNLEPGGSNTRGNHYLSVIGRLKPGVALSEAQAELDVVSRQMSEDLRESPVFARLIPLREDAVGRSRLLLYVLLGAVGILLLIACVNVANLFLARSVARDKEMAIRAALGASHLRLIRQLLTEGLLIAGLGGLFGLALAWSGAQALVALQPDSLPRLGTVALDSRLLAFNVGVTLLTVFLFGLVPALRSSRPCLTSVLNDAQKGSSVGRGHARLRNLLAAAQVALAVALLIGAGLLMKSFVVLSRVDLGFNPGHVTSFVVHLPDSRYGDPDGRRQFHSALTERIELMPGVEAAGSISKLPVAGPSLIWTFGIDGRPEPGRGEPWPMANIRCVDGDYFRAMEIPLLRGRLFDERDHAESRPVALISESVANRYWPGADPLGEGIRSDGRVRTIVGIVRDTRHDLRERASRKVYFPHGQFAGNRNWAMTQVVRTEKRRAGLLPLIRDELSRIDSDLIVHNARSMNEVIAYGVSQQRFAVTLMGAFAGVALLLAAVGVYGVLSYLVHQRTQEFGIRMALGADRRHVRGLVANQGLRLALVGMASGWAISLTMARWLSPLLFEVSVVDPAIYSGASLVIITVALFAGDVPARRAAHVEPLQALRCE